MCGGTRSASAVSHQIANSIRPTPARNANGTSTATGRPSANRREEGRPREGEQHAGAHRMARPPAEADQRADDRARAQDRREDAVDRARVPVLERHRGTERHARAEAVSSPNEKTRTITQIQLRERTSTSPRGSRPSTVARSLTSPRSRGRSPDQEGGRDEERRGVEREREAGADPEHERGGERRAGELGDRLDRAERGLRRSGSAPSAPSAAPGRCRPGGRTPRPRRQPASITREVPDLDGAGEDQRGEQRVQREADQVGDDHHPVARQAVGPHPADQQEPDERERRGRSTSRRRSASRAR